MIVQIGQILSRMALAIYRGVPDMTWAARSRGTAMARTAAARLRPRPVPPPPPGPGHFVTGRGFLGELREIFGTRTHRISQPPIQADSPVGRRAQMVVDMAAQAQANRQQPAPQEPISNQTPGQVAKRAALEGTLSAGATALSAAMGGFVTAGLTGAAALVAFTLALNRLGSAMLEAQKRLIPFNGQIAIAYARLQRGELQRAVESGRRRAPSITDLAGSHERLETQLQPWRDAVAILVNRITSGAKDALAEVMKAVNNIPMIRGALDNWLAEYKRDKDAGLIDRDRMARFFHGLAKDKRDKSFPIPKMQP